MAKRFNLRRIFILMSAAGAFGYSHVSMASAFGLWEQDAASIGNYHAGVTAIADDASTNWYNAAGLMRIKNQQVIVGADPILTDFRFNGTINNHNMLIPFGPQLTSAQGGGFNIVPFGHYAAPISDRFAFGFSVSVPFGLKTDYGNGPFTRYAATLTKLQVIDYSPSLALAITDKLSVAGGLDIQSLNAEFHLVGGAITPALDTNSNNSGSSTGYGYHLGALYQFTSATRVGVGYHSKVTHHVRGHSVFTGPLANGALGGYQDSKHFRANATLPATTILSGFHSFNPCWDVLGSVAYTQWDVFKELNLVNVAGISGFEATNDLVVTILERYRNSWNYSLGANYHPTERWTIRTGAGYDQSPTNNRYRNLQLPDSDRIALALGAHYQASKAIGIDAGWTHVIGMNTRINNVTQAFGDQVTTTNGSVHSNADVYGLQVKWDIV